MSTVDRLRAVEVTPQTALISIVVLLAVSVGGLTLLVKVLNGSSSSSDVRPSHPLHPATVAVAPTSGKAGAAVIDLKSVDYGVIVSRNLFRPVGKVAEVAPPPPPPPPPPNGGKPNPVPPYVAPVAPPPPLAYTGMVEVAGVTYALIESLELKLAQYTRLDGMAFGCKVTVIADNAVTVERNGKTYELKLGENKKDEATTPPQGGTPAAGGAPPAGGAPAAGNAPNPGGGKPGGSEQPGRGGSGGREGGKPATGNPENGNVEGAKPTVTVTTKEG